MRGTSTAESILDALIERGKAFNGGPSGLKEKPSITLSKLALQLGLKYSTSGSKWHWDQAWRQLSGCRLEFLLVGLQYLAFADLALVAEVFYSRDENEWRGGRTFRDCEGIEEIGDHNGVHGRTRSVTCPHGRRHVR